MADHPTPHSDGCRPPIPRRLETAAGLGRNTHLNDRSVKSRVISVNIDKENSFRIDYLIDGKPVAARTFAPSEYVCDKDGLRLSVYSRTGAVFNMLPNWGRLTITALLFRVDDHLYVKATNDTKALLLYFIPETALWESWNRFALYQP